MNTFIDYGQSDIVVTGTDQILYKDLSMFIENENAMLKGWDNCQENLANGGGSQLLGTLKV